MTDAGPERPAAIRAAVAGGVDWVQVRDRTLGGAALLDFVGRVIEAVAAGARTRGGTGTVLVNRRLDVAVAAGPAARASGTGLGLHLGFDAPPLAAARRALAELAAPADPANPGGPPGPVGVAAHAPEEVAAAAAAGADYAHLAPIFDPLSKPRERAALGTEALARASHLLGDHAATRLLAQGGIDAGTAAEALRAGAHGVAVTGAILGATHPGDAAARLRATLDAT